LCGVALTWICVAFGLFWLAAPHGCGSAVRSARMRVSALRDAVVTYQIETGRCPTTSYELIAGRYIKPADLIDNWGTGIRASCTDDQVHVTSAGPDHNFGTADDLTADY
jgi:hypothetical protein